MLKVTCAIIVQKNKILITQRALDSDHPLQWEFPGGKIKHGERAEDCIKREIHEELEIEIEILKTMISVIYNYGFKKIELIPFLCSKKTGAVKLNDRIDFNWDEWNNLEKLNFAEADLKLIQQMANRQMLHKYVGEKINNT